MFKQQYITSFNLNLGLKSVAFNGLFNDNPFWTVSADDEVHTNSIKIFKAQSLKTKFKNNL
jgi:hypothetical protein